MPRLRPDPRVDLLAEWGMESCIPGTPAFSVRAGIPCFICVEGWSNIKKVL